MGIYVGLLIQTALGIGLVLYIARLNRIEKENVALQNNLRQAQQFYDEMQERTESIRKYRHDLQRHIRIVEQFLEAGKQFEGFQEYRELQDYITWMQDDIEGISRRKYCEEDELINAICEIKAQEYREKGIPFDLQIHITEDSAEGIDPYYLTGILMNLLDNAMEAQLRSDMEMRRGVLFKMTEEKDGLAICIGNDVPEDFTADFKTSKHNKEEHGLGLGIARDYAGRYGGKLSIQYDEAEHYLTISTLLHPQR